MEFEFGGWRARTARWVGALGRGARAAVASRVLGRRRGRPPGWRALGGLFALLPGRQGTAVRSSALVFSQNFDRRPKSAREGWASSFKVVEGRSNIALGRIVGRHSNIRSKRSAAAWSNVRSQIGVSTCLKRPSEWTCMLGQAFGRSSSVWPANVHV